MRIVGGEYGGRPIAAPRSRDIRPTSDRLRETLFDILMHRFGAGLRGTRVLDLFAGTGALGLEALSRGAAYALFVEEGVEARGLIRRNIETLGLTGRTRIFRRDATRLGEAGTVAPFDLAFADPPYGRAFGERALEAALAGSWLKPGAICVLEESAKTSVKPIAGFEELEKRAVGDSQIIFLRATSG
jgi:16S rRNA (guanine966-N2)-methyltransferase